MKCLVCERWSWNIICAQCLDELPLTLQYRSIKAKQDTSYKSSIEETLHNDDVRVYSFYRYSDIAWLMQSKYDIIGSRVLYLLARKAARIFFQNITLPYPLQACGLDDFPYHAYSHTGVILHAFSKESQGKLIAKHGVLRAENHVRYAGKNLQFRQNNPKKFYYIGTAPSELILLDDIITTGTSFAEALSIFHNTQVLFCIALCDASM